MGRNAPKVWLGHKMTGMAQSLVCLSSFLKKYIFLRKQENPTVNGMAIWLNAPSRPIL